MIFESSYLRKKEKKMASSTKVVNKNFLELKGLISVLKKEELTLAKKHLSAFESYHTKEPSKMLRLFKGMLKYPDIQYDRLKKLVSKEITNKSFNQLIARTSERVQESIILDINLNRKENYSTIFQNQIKIRKYLIQSKVLYGRGMRSITIKLIDWVLKTSKKYELYDELVEAIYFKQGMVLSTKGEKSFLSLENDLNFYENCRVLLRKSRQLYRSYYASISFKGKVQNDYSFLINAITQIENFYQNTKSANILSYLLLLKLEKAVVFKDYDLGKEAGESFIKALKESAAIYSPVRAGIINYNICDNEISALRFKDAITFGLRAKKILFEFSMNLNSITTIDLLSLAYFYNEDYINSIKVIDELDSNNQLNKFPLQKSILIYRKAICYFSTGKYRDASLLFNNLQEIEKDKEGWNLWIRIMRILCSIELLKLNMIDYDVESFRKYIQRLNRSRDVRKRDQLILKILIELDRVDFDFKKVEEKRKEELELLNSTNMGYEWEPKSPEMVIFGDWFQAKLNKQAYHPNFDRYRKESTKESPKKRKESKPLETNNHQGQLAIEF